MLLLWAAKMGAQEWAVKSNVLSDLTATLNVAGELRLAEQYSVQLGVSYNPFCYSDNHKTKLFMVKPEARWWLSEVFYGAYVGTQLHYARFNFAGMTPVTTLREHRYQGNSFGISVSGGYHWMLSTFWNIEASLAVGYMHQSYSKFGPAWNDPFIRKGHSNYIGPTQANLSLVYFLR